MAKYKTPRKPVKKAKLMPKTRMELPPVTASPNTADTEMRKLMQNKGSPRARIKGGY